MKDEHKFPDRVRLPRSLLTSLQGSRPLVPLAVSVLDIGPGNLFKVRSRTEGRMEGRAARRLPGSACRPMAMEKAMGCCSSRPSQAHLWSLWTSDTHWSSHSDIQIPHTSDLGLRV